MSIKKFLRILIVKFKFRKSRVSLNSIVSFDTILGEGVSIFENCRLGECKVGRYTYICNDSTFERTTIGSFCSIAEEVKCGIAAHPLEFVSTYPGFYSDTTSGAKWFGNKSNFYDKKYVEIGSDVWIGLRAVILGGIKIGTGAVVAAGSSITI